MAPMPPTARITPERDRADLQLTRGVENKDGRNSLEEDALGDGGQDDGTQQTMSEQRPQTGLDVAARAARSPGIDRRFGRLDPPQQDGRDQKGDSVDHDGARRREELHEQTRDTRSARFRG